MNADAHERARLMISYRGPEGLSHAGLSEAELSQIDQSWLTVHLESCPACREFAENSRQTIRSLRGIPITASASLASTTRARVRQRARELQRRRERLRVIWVCSAAVTLCTAFNTALLWRGVGWLSQWLSQQWGQQWISQQAPLSAPLLELGFVALCSMPAIVAGIILLARGTYMADHNRSFQG